MRPSLRKALYISAGIIIIILAALTAASFYMLRFSLAPDPNRRDTDSTYNILYSRFPDMKPWMDSIRAGGHLRDTFVVSPAGERQHAYYLACDDACGKTAVLVHGYKDSAIKFFYFGRMYNRDLHYNVLMPDLHAHGLSDGNDIQMGWKDADEVLNWIKVAEEIFRDDNYRTAMIVHGVSMGAATTMNVSGKDLPEYVNAFVEDCGYTSVWDEFSMQLKEMFGLPAFPLMHSTSLLCNMKYGWNFKEASPLISVSRCTRPMLFIHGDADDFVPFSMMQPLYDAKPEPKEFWVAPGSAHANAYRDHPEEYTAVVRQFLDKWNRP
ncbi:MAG: alpha/beta hydrolase [Candidatus Cryptobacteroides sp.]|nr:alpha/beta hydrolase [Bacteroidales bacterium]MDY3964353.1 alpha/beta hydrolase [Candidatus Cryptobacteroides sp.]